MFISNLLSNHMLLIVTWNLKEKTFLRWTGGLHGGLVYVDYIYVFKCPLWCSQTQVFLSLPGEAKVAKTPHKLF